MARCPAHEDHDPSLSLRPIEGQVLIYCHAGCDTRDVLAALGMGWADLYDNPRGAEYRYDDGRVVHRTPAKAFRQSGNTTGTAQLYRLTKVKAAIAANEIVYVVEGEKDVHALESLGAVATTNPMGAANWAKVDPSPLHGGKVIVVPDVDQAGRRWVRDVLASLAGMCESLDVRAPRVGKHPADHVAADQGLDDLISIKILPDEPSSDMADQNPVSYSRPLTGTRYGTRTTIRRSGSSSR